MLQTRSGKRTGYAAVLIATDFVAEKLVKPREALLLVEPEALSQLLAPVFDPAEWKKLPVVTKGLPASPGRGVGPGGVHVGARRRADQRTARRCCSSARRRRRTTSTACSCRRASSPRPAA